MHHFGDDPQLLGNQATRSYCTSMLLMCVSMMQESEQGEMDEGL